MYGEDNQIRTKVGKPKIKMDTSLYSKEKMRAKSIKIWQKVEVLKEEINKVFDKVNADAYIRKKTIYSMKKDLKDKGEYVEGGLK